MAFCTKCGATMDEGARFCHECEKANEVSQSEEQAKYNIHEPVAPVDEKEFLPPRKGIKGLFWNFINIKKIDKSAQKKAVLFASVFFVAVIALLIGSIQFGSVFIYRAMRTEPTVNSVKNSWNKEADKSPDGPTYGIKITSEVISSQKEIDLKNNATVRFILQGGRVISVHYNSPDLSQQECEQALAGIVRAVFPKGTKYLSVATQSLITAINELPIKEAVAGFIVGSPDASKMSVYTIYPYSKALMASSQKTGLNFGIGLVEYSERFTSVFNKESEASAKYKYKSNVSDDEYIYCAKTIIDENLKSPGSAIYNDVQVLEKDKYGRAIITGMVDAQNSFGANLRNYFCVVIQGVYYNDDLFDHFAGRSLSFYSSVNMMEQGIDLMKAANDFDKPLSNYAMRESEFKSSEEIGEYKIRYREDTLNCYAYLDSDEKIAAIRVSCAVSFVDNEFLRKLLRIHTESLDISTSNYGVTDILDNWFDFSTQTPKESSYKNGILYESYIENNTINFCATAVSVSKYESEIKGIKDLKNQ